MDRMVHLGPPKWHRVLQPSRGSVVSKKRVSPISNCITLLVLPVSRTDATETTDRNRLAAKKLMDEERFGVFEVDYRPSVRFSSMRTLYLHQVEKLPILFHAHTISVPRFVPSNDQRCMTKERLDYNAQHGASAAVSSGSVQKIFLERIYYNMADPFTVQKDESMKVMGVHMLIPSQDTRHQKIRVDRQRASFLPPPRR